MEHLCHTPTPKPKGTLQQDFKEPEIGRTWAKQCLLDIIGPLHSRSHDSHGWRLAQEQASQYSSIHVCMCVCALHVHMRICACMFICMCVCISMCMCVCMHVSVCTHACAHEFVCIPVHIQVCVHPCALHVLVHVHVHLCVCVCVWWGDCYLIPLAGELWTLDDC